MKIIRIIIFLILGLSTAEAQTTNPNLLVNIPKASQVEIDAYTAGDLELGMLVYNTDINRIFIYTNLGFLEIKTGKTSYSGSFIITSTGDQTITGLPFEPSSVTMTARPNIETATIDSDNAVGNNNNTVSNVFGSMNGIARQDGANISQQVIFVGGNANSINNISRYASLAYCVGVRYANQNANSLGKTTASLSEFTSDGFKINVSEKADNLLVLFTAYR